MDQSKIMNVSSSQLRHLRIGILFVCSLSPPLGSHNTSPKEQAVFNHDIHGFMLPQLKLANCDVHIESTFDFRRILW